MIISGMDEFQNICKRKLVDWYNSEYNTANPGTKITEDQTFIVWSCKTLQNFKCLAATSVSGDNVYAEFTYNGDKHELYMDVYNKVTNWCIK